MKYTDSYPKLKQAFELNQDKIELENLEIYRYKFHSSSHKFLPGNPDHYCKKHDLHFNDENSFFNDIGMIEDNLHIKDFLIQENKDFEYFVLKLNNGKPVKDVTFLFHGFNEKNWDKYLPWGRAICEKTETAIVFFPIAFHMQRAPHKWSEKRAMFELSKQRQEKFPNIVGSTLSNVAISVRLHSMPQRFIWSGLQTYYDTIQLIEECKSGNHPLIDKDFNFNIFAYSIGGLLAEILKLTNYNNYFDNSKVCLFCSGAVFNRMSPVSKYILDSEANIAMYTYLIEHFEVFLKKDPLLHHYMMENHFEGIVFHSMFEYQKMLELREGLLKKFEKDFYAVTLKDDDVIPYFEVINTLKGSTRNIDIKVDVFDFEYNYSHVTPFPQNSKTPDLVDETFDQVFSKISDFYKS